MHSSVAAAVLRLAAWCPGAPMTANERASPSTPALAAAYAGERNEPSTAPTMLPTSTTDPRAATSAGWRSSQSRRRMLWTRLARPILVVARARPIGSPFV